MIKLVKRFKTLLITISFAYVFIVFSLVCPSNYSVITPGGLTNINQNLVIDSSEYETLSNFHSIYVSSYNKMTYFQYLITSLNGKYDVSETSKYYDDISAYDEYLMGQVSKKGSYQYSIIHAYELAKMTDSNISVNYTFNGLRLYYRPNRYSQIHINDLIVKIESGDVSYSVNEATDFTLIAEMIELSKKQTFKITVKRENEEIEQVISYEDGDYLMTFYPDFTVSSTPVVKMPGLDSNIGGPSGGLLQTMALYSSLTKLDLGNLKIAGTGTLGYDGKIGKIGGARQKVYTAVSNNVDYFFIAKQNYDDVVNGKQQGIKGMVELDSFKKYYVVENINEVLEILKGLNS